MTPKQILAAIKKHGGVRPAARALGLGRGRVRTVYNKAVAEGTIEAIPAVPPTNSQRSGKETVPYKDEVTERRITRQTTERVKAKKTKRIPRPRSGVKRYLLSCAQNNTSVHEMFWKNLEAFADDINATIHVSRFTYNKHAYIRRSGLVGKGSQHRNNEPFWWAKEVAPYLSDDRIELAPGLIWCGDMDILPTANRPLSGLETFTGRKSGVFPHPKIAMESVPSQKLDPTKFNYTTGTVTLRNYIQRKAGLKAEFHHCYGALLVEVDNKGNWWCRQINADSGGTFYDLDTRVQDGKVTYGHRVEGITWGDLHIVESDPVAMEVAFGPDGIKDTLRPKYDFLHDTISFQGRSHHEMKDPHTMFLRHTQGMGDVEKEVREAGEFICTKIYRDWCDTVSVYSNHEQHLGRWLKEQDGRFDPVNAEFWTKLQAATFDHIRIEGEEPNYFRMALSICFPDALYCAQFLLEDQAFILCPDAAGGIDNGMHGHRGPRGSRGTPQNISKAGRKANIGHHHGARIIDGVYVSGTKSRMDTDWTKGMSDWSWSDIITYPNGKRAIITTWDKKWRA